MRIALMVLRLFFKAFYYFGRIWWCSIHENISYEEGFRWAKKTTLAANRAGRVKIEAMAWRIYRIKTDLSCSPTIRAFLTGLYSWSPVPGPLPLS